MTLEQTLPFLIFSLVAAITPGPSNVMITATGSAAGIMRGLPCVFGAAAGMATLLFTAALGLGQLILGHREILRVMNLFGAAFLLWLAGKIANAGRAGEAGATQPALPSGFVWLVLGASMQRLLRDERSVRIFNTVTALALAASVVMIFW